MGCFNIACFATNQTIGPGDLCRVLPVIQASSYRAVELSRGEEKTSAFGVASSTCYPDSFWGPAGGFIQAKYDDYGRVTLELDPLMRAHVMRVFSDLLRSGYVTAQGENECHDLPFDLPVFLADKAPGVLDVLTSKKSGDLEDVAHAIDWRDGDIDGELVATWDYIWEVVFKQRLFIAKQGHPRTFSFAVVHELAYQALVAAAAGAEDWDGLSMAPTAVLHRGLAKAREELVTRPVAPERAYMEGFRLADTLRSIIGRADRQSGSLAGMASDCITSGSLALVEKRITEDQLLDMLLPLLQDQQAYGALNNLNVRISPMITAGQDYDNSDGAAYASFVSQVSRDIVRGRKEHMYGAFRRYALRAASQADIDKLTEEVQEWDAAIEGVDVTQVDGVFAVTFSCTLELGDLREALQDEGFTLMADTLVSVQDASDADTKAPDGAD
jgi:hypothetical protein